MPDNPQKRFTYYCPECKGETLVRDGSLWKCINPVLRILSTGEQKRCTYRGQWPHRKEILEMKSE